MNINFEIHVPRVDYVLYFQLAAATMISFGVWSYAEKNKYYYQEITTIYDIFLDLSIVLIIIGIIMFLITFAGFVGALRENTFLLKFVSTCLIIP